MSRIGQKPLAVPKDIQVQVAANTVTIKGPRGELHRTLHPLMSVAFDGTSITVSRPGDEPRHKALHGLSRTLIANMIEGVSRGYERTLEIQGVGYKAEVNPKGLLLNLGFSHQVSFPAPPGIKFVVENNTVVKVSGPDKELVGQVTAELRSIRPPEPYKGKGIRYLGERVRRKAGKTAGK